MARGRKVILVSAAAAAAAWHLSQPSFVPPARRSAMPAAAAAALAAGSAPAFADEIGDAARKLSDAAYPFLKDINWNSYTFATQPGKASPGDWTKAIDKMIVMGSAMDPSLLKAGVQAHHKALGGISEANPVISKDDFEAINAAIGRMIASVPEDKTMDVYNAIAPLVSPDVPPYLMSTVKEEDAKAAYAALMEFKDVVKAHPITPQVAETPAALADKLSAINAAAVQLSSASYNFVKDVDWKSDVYLKPLPGVSPQQLLKAIDKMLVMGASMDGKLLQQAGEAHHNAIASMDDKLVTTAADYEAVNNAIGKLVASVPESQVMAVYTAFSKILKPEVGFNMFSKVLSSDALGAYNALMKYKDVVHATHV